MVVPVSAQIFGIGAMFALFLTYQQNDRKKLLICKLCADICWVAHYMCLGASGGAIPNFVGIFRELVFVNRESKRQANNFLWPVVFILANFILGIFILDSILGLLPICASALVTVSLWCKRPVMTKIISVPVSMSFLIYDIFVGSWIGVINESIALLSIFISFINALFLKNGGTKND